MSGEPSKKDEDALAERMRRILAGVPGIDRPICYVHDAPHMLCPYDPADHECKCGGEETSE
jgi:hypothetical protein